MTNELSNKFRKDTVKRGIEGVRKAVEYVLNNSPTREVVGYQLREIIGHMAALEHDFKKLAEQLPDLESDES